jgi:hypothetical protein
MIRRAEKNESHTFLRISYCYCPGLLGLLPSEFPRTGRDCDEPECVRAFDLSRTVEQSGHYRRAVI